MTNHEKLLKEKFPHAKEDMLYNSGGNVMWSLFRTQSDGLPYITMKQMNFI